jgi:hypothetical protein
MVHEHKNLDGCEIDFKEAAIGDDEVESLLIPAGEEEDEVDDEDEPLSPGSPDRGLATRLRRGAAILGTPTKPLFEVREVAGWKDHGRDFAGTQPTFSPLGSVNHHTAGAPPSAGNAPSLGIIVNGRGGSNPLSGPLAQILQAYDDTAIVCAAGVANHAGSGGWKGAESNFEMYGLEVEHPGTSMVAQRRVLVMVSIHAIFLWRPTGPDLKVAMSCQHWEWSDAGKIDFAKNFSTQAQANQFRVLVGQQLAKLNAVNTWTVSYLDAKRVRIPRPGDKPIVVKDPSAWSSKHKPAHQRGKVIFTPVRG